MRITLLSILVLLSLTSFGTTFTSVGSGDWSDDAIWNSAPGDNDCAPSGNHTYNINHYVSSACPSLDFTGSVIINVGTGATFYLSGSGGISGSVTLNIAAGGTVIVVGNLNLSGSSDVSVNGTLNVNGNIVGVGSTFDCNGSSNTGTVNIGGTGCTNCTNTADGGCTQNAPLPVNLIDFDAKAVGNSITIFWTTSYEKDNDHFILERSADGVEFVAVYNVAGKINSTAAQNYSFVDGNLLVGNYYYRLVQIDVDGTKTRTEAIAVSLSGIMQMLVAPNPGGISQVALSITTTDNSPVMVVLLDVTGTLLNAHTYHVENNSAVISLQELHSEIKPGVYMITASSNNLLINQKIVVY